MPFYGRKKCFSKWNRIHTNGKPVHRAHTQCIDSNRASYEKRKREKTEEESIQKSISMQSGVLLIQMYCSVLKLLLLLSLAFGLTAFYSSQLDMVFKWRKSNSFKWIAIIVRKREKKQLREQKTSNTMHVLYNILTRRCCWCCWKWSNDRRKWRNCSLLFCSVFFRALIGKSDQKLIYLINLNSVHLKNSSSRVLSTYKSLRCASFGSNAHLFGMRASEQANERMNKQASKKSTELILNCLH